MDKGYYLISVLLGLILTVNKLDTMFNSYAILKKRMVMVTRHSETSRVEKAEMEANIVPNKDFWK